MPVKENNPASTDDAQYSPSDTKSHICRKLFREAESTIRNADCRRRRPSNKRRLFHGKQKTNRESPSKSNSEFDEKHEDDERLMSEQWRTDLIGEWELFDDQSREPDAPITPGIVDPSSWVRMATEVPPEEFWTQKLQFETTGEDEIDDILCKIDSQTLISIFEEQIKAVTGSPSRLIERYPSFLFAKSTADMSDTIY